MIVAHGWRRVLLAVGLAVTLGATLAATLTVDAGDDPDARLELRSYTLPDGTEAELVVLTGEAIVVTVDDVRIEGSRLEIDVDRQLVRVVGEGAFEVGDERVEGTDLEVALDEERVRAIDAIVFTGAIDVTGDLAERLPGQVTFANAFASPCTRCGQSTPDYGFYADRLVLYPGDRLVGYDVTVVIRDVPVFTLPVLVLPLASGDRQPQLVVTSGSASQRAEVRVRWPYVAGDAALGTFTVRYLAEVDASRPGGLAGRLLGGAVETSAFGFELDHRAYDDRGTAVLTVAYDPGRGPDATDPGRATIDPTWTVRARYATEPGGPGPDIDVGLTRDDTTAPGRWLYAALLADERDGVRGTFTSQGFVDTDPGTDPETPPTYAGRGTPRRTGVRMRLEPLEAVPWRVGRLQVTAAALDLGVFEDVANPTNRRAAALGIVDDGRALVAHTVRLEPVTPWPGARLEGDNVFEGRYYGSGERAITWLTRLALLQRFGESTQLELAAVREVEEGETPFRFDAASPRARTEATARFSTRLAPWVSLTSSGGYVFVESRRPETVGWAPLVTDLDLFADRPWLSAGLEHRWPIADDDAGTLAARVSVQGRATPAELRLSIDHVADLQPEPGPPVVDDGRTVVAWSAAVDRAVALSFEGTYRAVDPATPADEPGWTAARARASIGSLRSGDARPGLGIEADLDLARSRVTDLTVTARGEVGPVALDLRQRVSLPDAIVTDARIGVTWRDVATLDARGFVWLPPTWFGYAEPEPRPRTLSVRLGEARARGQPRWEATWRTTLDPALEADGGRRDTRFEARLALVQERIGPVNLSVEGLAEWSLADARQSEPYLRRAAVVFGADAWERVGFQGRLGYAGAFDPATGELARSELAIQELTLAVRATDEVLVGARLRDVWELTGTVADRSPWTVRPEVFFVWDRCCWALVGAWDASTGDIRIALTGPGGGAGLGQVIETDLVLPRTPLPETP